MSKKTYKIPFKKNGKTWEMMEYSPAAEGMVSSGGQMYTPAYTGHFPDEWRDIVEFDDTLQISSWFKGRSAARVNVEGSRANYSMSLSAFYDAVVAFGVKKGGVIKGRWTFRKQGANYSLWPVT